MKKTLKRAISLVLLCVMVFSLASCSLISPIIGESGFFGLYKSVALTDVDSVISDINARYNTAAPYITPYEVSYKYEYVSGGEYVYTTSYDVDAKINVAANKGEVMALIKFITKYEQDDGQHGRDCTIDICIVRTGDDNDFSDYTVTVSLNGTTNTASLSQMRDDLDAADRYYSDPGNHNVTTAFNTSFNGNSDYFEMILKWIEVKFGQEIVSTSDNPLNHITHDFNMGMIIDLISEAKTGSEEQYKVSMADKDALYRVSRSYDMNMGGVKETLDKVYFLKLVDYNSYSSKMTYSYTRKTPYEDINSTYEKTVNPLSDLIEKPDFVQ